MLHVHHVNLQPIVGGGEVYTRALTRALLDAGARVTLHVHPSVELWRDLAAPGLTVRHCASEGEMLAHLPDRSLVLTQCPLSGECIAELAARHVLTGFAHMPMIQRSAGGFRPFRLVFTVSHYCVDLLRGAGLAQVFPEPMYGTAELARGSAPVRKRNLYLVDPQKPRDILLGHWERATERWRGRPYTPRPGLTLGIVSLIAPIKQFPALFSIVAPHLARHPSVHLEVFGAGGYGQVRDLRQALAPLGERVRFWGFQPDVAAVYPLLDYLMTGLPEKEALGLNAIEAQFCGTPVLAPDAPPFTETVEDQAGGFRYRDPREDGGRHFAEILSSIVAGRPRPDPRVASAPSLRRFTHEAMVERARHMIQALAALG